MNKLNNILMSLAVGVFSAQAMAASDGTIGTTSSGQSVVSLSVADRVQISSVADIALGTYSGSGNLTGTSEYCVFRNGGGNYKVTLTTDQSAFEVAGTSGSIPFSVKVDDDLTPADGEALSYATASSVALVASNAANCGGSDNGALEVSFNASDLQAATTDSYSATMTILVEPI